MCGGRRLRGGVRGRFRAGDIRNGMEQDNPGRAVGLRVSQWPGSADDGGVKAYISFLEENIKQALEPIMLGLLNLYKDFKAPALSCVPGSARF